MSYILTIIIGVLLALDALALIFIVLLQNPKSEGGDSLFSGGSQMKQLVGVAEMPSFQRKVTYILLGILFALSLLFSWALFACYADTVYDV